MSENKAVEAPTITPPSVDSESPEQQGDWQHRMDLGSDRMGRIEASIEEVRATMMTTHARFEAKLDENSKTTFEAAAAAKDTAETVVEIKDILMLGKSFIRIMGYVGTVIKWGAGIATALVGMWFTLRYGKPPP